MISTLGFFYAYFALHFSISPYCRYYYLLVSHFASDSIFYRVRLLQVGHEIYGVVSSNQVRQVGQVRDCDEGRKKRETELGNYLNHGFS